VPGGSERGSNGGRELLTASEDNAPTPAGRRSGPITYAEGVRPLCLVLALLAVTPVARAQDVEAIPVPPAPAAAPADEVDDDALIRWASRSLALWRAEPVSDTRRFPPLPPDEYLEHGAAGPTARLPSTVGRDGGRLLAELGGGALGVLVGGGAGALLIWAANEGGAEDDWLAIAVGGGVLLGSLGVTGGVTLGAHLAGGHGNFGHAFMGQVIGAAASLPLVVIGMENDALPLTLVALGVLPLAGAILGYEIGHGEHALSGGPVAFVAPTRGGAFAGVAGSVW